MITSKEADVEVSIPGDIKANLILQTGTGKVYSNLNSPPNLILNGGGIGISVSNQTGDIYLKKQEK
jgi:hypothetical protein